MKMAENNSELELLFARARQERDQLPDALAVRMMSDAEAVRLHHHHPSPRTVSGRWWQGLDVIGGWPGMSGLVAAGCAGIWIGFVAPSFLPDPANFLLSQDPGYLSAELDLDDVYLEDTQ